MNNGITKNIDDSIVLKIRERINIEVEKFNFNPYVSYNYQFDMFIDEKIKPIIEEYGDEYEKIIKDILLEHEPELKRKHIETRISDRINGGMFLSPLDYKSFFDDYQDRIIKPLEEQYGPEYKKMIDDISLKNEAKLKRLYVKNYLDRKIKYSSFSTNNYFKPLLNDYQNEIINELGFEYKDMVESIASEYEEILKKEGIDKIINGNWDFRIKLRDVITNPHNWSNKFIDEIKKNILPEISQFCGNDANSFKYANDIINDYFYRRSKELLTNYINEKIHEFVKCYVNEEMSLQDVIERITEIVQDRSFVFDNKQFPMNKFIEEINGEVMTTLVQKGELKPQIEKLITQKLGSDKDKMFTFYVDGEKVTLKRKNMANYFLVTEKNFDQSATFEEVNLDKAKINEVNNFFDVVGQGFGMDQGTFKDGFTYDVNSGLLKYKDVILEYVNKKYPTLYEDVVKAFNQVAQESVVSQLAYNIIMEALLDKYGKEETSKVLNENFRMLEVEDTEINRLIKKLVDSGFDEIDAKKIISTIDSVGVCTYAAFGNVIISSFKDYPVLFKKHFGFDLFGKNGFNEKELLLDMFIEINKQSNNGRIIDDVSSDKPKVSLYDRQDMVYLTSPRNFSGYACDAITEYLQKKGLNIDIRIITENEHQCKVFEEIVNGLLDNKLIEITAHYGVTLCPVNNDGNYITLNAENMHAMFVTGIDKEKLYVSSWGRKYYINLENLKDTNCSIYMTQLNYDKTLSKNEEVENDVELLVQTKNVRKIQPLSCFQEQMSEQEQKDVLTEDEVELKRKVDAGLNQIQIVCEKKIEDKINGDKELEKYFETNLREIIDNIMNDNLFENYISKMAEHYVSQFLEYQGANVYNKILEYAKNVFAVHLQKLLYDELQCKNRIQEVYSGEVNRDIIAETILKIQKKLGSNPNELQILQAQLSNITENSERMERTR